MKPLLVAALMTASATARAEDSPIAPLKRDESHMTIGMAELGVGLLTLPGAQVCNTQQAGCEKGDTSLALSAWPLFRRGNFAAGAGVMMGITSSTNAPRNDPPGIERDHTRRYYSVEVTARYYVPFAERFEGWGGITTGLGVVNDSFQSRNGVTDEAIIGPRGVTLLTEGFTIGIGIGADYAIAKNWRLGAFARLSNWFLPKTPSRDPLGDEASLRGRVNTIDFGLTLAYRTRLVF